MNLWALLVAALFIITGAVLLAAVLVDSFAKRARVASGVA